MPKISTQLKKQLFKGSEKIYNLNQIIHECNDAEKLTVIVNLLESVEIASRKIMEVKE